MKISELIAELSKQYEICGDEEIEISKTSNLYRYIRPNEIHENIRITIGDWSNDGHCQSDSFHYDVDAPVSAIQKAFIDSCLKYKISFCKSALDVNSEFRDICRRFEDSELDYPLVKHLMDLGLDVTKYIDCDLENITEETDTYDVFDPDAFAILVLDVAKLSLDFNYSPTSNTENSKNFNGWWQEGPMNMQIGYGLYCL